MARRTIKTTIYSSEASLPLWGYYRCSKCGALNCFKTSVSYRKSSSFKWLLKLSSKNIEQDVLRKRETIIENAKKGIYFAPSYTGKCISCQNVEFWQNFQFKHLTEAMVYSPIAVILLFLCLIAMDQSNVEWVLLLVPVAPFLFKLLERFLCKVKTNANLNKVPDSSLPQYYDEAAKMFENASNALKQGEKPLKNTSIQEG